MLCEHVVKVSRLGKYLFIEKVTTVSRFVPIFGSVCMCFISLVLTFLLLIKSASFTGQLIYEKLPSDISERHVLLLDPILGTGL